MEKMVKILHSKSVLVLLVVVFALTFASCRLGYTVKNARFANEFSWVYHEKEFDFSESNANGTLDGSFGLPKNIKVGALDFYILFPATFRNQDWDRIVTMSYKLTFKWEGGSFEKTENEVKTDWYGLDIYLSEDDIKQIPLATTITYTLEYSNARYTKLETKSDGVDKLDDLKVNPEKYPHFYDAVFVVAEHTPFKS